MLELLYACVPLPRVLHTKRGTHGPAKFTFLVNLIFNNESNQCKQKDFFSFEKIIIFLNLDLAEN